MGKQEQFTSILPAIRVIHYAYRSVGMFWYQLPDNFQIASTANRHSLLTYTKSGVLVTILFYLLFAAICIENMFLDFYVSFSSSIIYNTVARSTLLLGTVGSLLNFTAMLFLRRPIWNFYCSIHECDRMLVQLGQTIDFRRQAHLSAGLVLFWLFTCLSGQSLRFMDTRLPNWYTTVIHLTSLVITSAAAGAFACQNIIFMAFVGTRLQFMNERIRDKFLKNPTLPTQNHMDITTKICKEIRDLRKIHMRLFELGECINRHFSPLILNLFIATTLLAFLGITQIYQFLYKDKSKMRISPIVNLYWTMYFVTFVLLTITISNWMTNQARKTTYLSDEVLNVYPKFHGSYEMTLLSQQSRLCMPIIQNKMFRYDWNLFYAMLGTVSMNVIIYLQFEMDPKG